MATIIKLEIFKVMRNRRFLFFTFLIPLLFYVFLFYFLKSQGAMDEGSLLVSLAVLSSIFATVGGAINTLSSRVAREKPYIGNVLVTTPFTPVKFILVTTLVQFVLGLLIECIIVLFGVLVMGLKLTGNLVLMEVIVLYGSIFYILLGLSLGFWFDAVALQSLSYPIYMIIMATTVTHDSFSKIPEFFEFVQRIFPGYFMSRAVSEVGSNAAFAGDLLTLTVYIAVMLVLSIFAYRIKKQSLAG